MFKIIIRFFSLLTPSQRKRFYVLQVMIVIMTFVEIVSIISIAPFMALVGDLSILERDNLLSMLYLKSNLGTFEFIFYLGLIVLITLVIAAIVSMYITWRISMFAPKIGAEISHRLYSYYLDKDLLFHTMTSSSDLTKKIAKETERVTQHILAPLMYMNARIVLVFFIIFTMLLYDPIVIIIALTVFGGGYVILFKFVRTRLERNGKHISDMLAERFKLMRDAFGGIRDILLLGRSSHFKKQFFKTGNKLSYSEGNNIVIGLVPRYFMELLAFGSMIALVLYLIKNSEGNLGIILPIISVYALAGMKLLPAILVIYSSATTVKGNLAAYESIREDLANIKVDNESEFKNSHHAWSKHNEISLKEVTFTYPGKENPALENISLKIKPNTIVGFVGTSGSGKSTLADVIIGLIKPQQGEVTIDGTPLIKQNLRVWQNKIGFVPQTIFLTEGTIAENVAFGIPQDLINYRQVEKALKLAHLEEYVSKLENGVHSKVGERGVQLSGGQRQRVGIARTLYYEAEVLVFDEATSALDGITEKTIMNAIHDFTGQKTLIIIAHRLQTVQKCDEIFMMEKARIVDRGTYQYLLENNEQFKKMSDHA
jgi:HlyD family secretion protein